LTGIAPGEGPAAAPDRRRRHVINAVSLATLGGLAFGLYRIWPEQGLRNACHAALPRALSEHALVRAAWEGLDPADVWDAHVHLVGVGDSDSGVYVNPSMTRPANPLLYARFLFYLNAGCVHDAPGRVDETYVARLLNLVEGMRPGCKAMLFAFDGVVDEHGAEQREHTMFMVPNEYAARVAHAHPAHFEWVASIHPYRADALDRLAVAAARGARAVKWLPNAMMIDPAAPRCRPFFDALARYRLPLITHAGYEAAVHSPEGQALGNPLKLRHALDRSVRVIVAHCASLGSDADLDVGPNGPTVASFELFARLMGEERYVGRLYGEVSAMILRNRVGSPLAQVLERTDWHERLVNGSDYPLPGILPIVSVDGLVRDGFLAAELAGVLREIREHNPLLFDFALKRSLRWRGRAFAPCVFATRALFATGGSTA
jgi:mannonate dehydratase